MRISEALDKIESQPYLSVSADSTLEKVAEQITREKRIRGIYVLDKRGRLEGYLSLGVLIRNVVISRNQPRFHIRSLLTQITSEKVADIMETHVVCARKNDPVERILDLMGDRNMKEIPIVDEDRRIIAIATILDLWRLIEKGKYDDP
jgi:CBS domain-containing protein